MIKQETRKYGALKCDIFAKCSFNNGPLRRMGKQDFGEDISPPEIVKIFPSPLNPTDTGPHKGMVLEHFDDRLVKKETTAGGGGNYC